MGDLEIDDQFFSINRGGKVNTKSEGVPALVFRRAVMFAAELKSDLAADFEVLLRPRGE